MYTGETIRPKAKSKARVHLVKKLPNVQGRLQTDSIKAKVFYITNMSVWFAEVRCSYEQLESLSKPYTHILLL